MVGYTTGGRWIHEYVGFNRLPYTGYHSPLGSRYSQTVHTCDNQGEFGVFLAVLTTAEETARRKEGLKWKK
jgi:hypothetical protein